jgi:hypothetical protein
MHPSIQQNEQFASHLFLIQISFYDQFGWTTSSIRKVYVGAAPDVKITG